MQDLPGSIYMIRVTSYVYLKSFCVSESDALLNCHPGHMPIEQNFIQLKKTVLLGMPGT